MYMNIHVHVHVLMLQIGRLHVASILGEPCSKVLPLLPNNSAQNHGLFGRSKVICRIVLQ